APARALADFRAGLAHVDAVDLVTPADSHLTIAAECLRSGKACFVEKPLAANMADGNALVAAQRSSGGFLQVGHIFRFHPVTEVLRQRIGTAGTVRYCTGRFAGFKRPRTDVGVTMTDAIHYVDLFAHLLGRSPTAVTATLSDHLGRGMDDCSFSTVEYGGVAAFIEAGYFAPGTFRDCVIVGEALTLAADFASSEVRVHGNRHVRSPEGWQAAEGSIEMIKASGPEPLRRELELFVDAVARRARPIVDVEAGLLALRAVAAARRSSELGRRVALSEVG
ncbi:MAG TPA: Gfo/Idh/MocA family oxidoreductase, partial [Candidatus Methylomirabilis sp.]|nr:Gfo/Idh/MocA family oxidoreductase [Candidatus Methylomirabilis sp.]